MRTGVEQTRSQKEKAQREESKADESLPTDAPQPKELERRPVLALALVSFAGLVEGLLPRRAQAPHSPTQLSGSRLRRDDRRPRRPDPAPTQRRVLDGPRVLARGRVR